jgi:hypothetical protein
MEHFLVNMDGALVCPFLQTNALTIVFSLLFLGLGKGSQEMVKIVKALFADNQKRDKLIEQLQRQSIAAGRSS